MEIQPGNTLAQKNETKQERPFVIA